MFAPKLYFGSVMDPQDQELFAQARREWSSLDHDAFLFHAFSKVGLGIVAATAGSALNWTQVKIVTARTPGGRVGIYGIQLLKLAFVPAGIAAAFYVSWGKAALIALIWLLVSAFILDVPVTRRSVVRGAASDMDAFDELWDMGAVALVNDDRQVFAWNRAHPTRWQDVVLRQLGWSELLETYPLSREEAVAEIIAKGRASSQATNQR